MASSKVPLVFIHGLKGSMLVNSANQTQYLTASQLFVKSGNIALPTRWIKYEDYLKRHEEKGDEKQSADFFKYRFINPPEYIQEFDDIRATEPIDSITLIPYLLSRAVYGPFLQWARATGRKVLPFAYDWRRDPMESTERFLQFLERVQSEHGKVQIVSHSMGGLITFSAMLTLGPERASQFIQSVIFCGVPFGSGVGILSTTHDGDVYLRNDVLIGPLTFATFPSGFIFHPVDDAEAQRHGGQIRDAAGQRIAMNWFDAKEWERLKIGAFSFPTFPVTDEFRVHFQHTLDAARRFALLNRGHSWNHAGNDLANKLADPRWPPCVAFMTDNHPTKNVFAPNNDPRKRGWAVSMVDAEPGDGTVRRSCSTPPFGFPLFRFVLGSAFKNSAHAELCSQVDLLSRQLADLLVFDPNAPPK